MSRYNILIETAINASIKAGIEIIKIYDSNDFGVQVKSDNSPLTRADLASNNEILSHLQKTHIPILSEEEKEISYETRKNWEQFWMVDPLDGTKEFIKRNGEFTVNIALIEQNKSVLGVIYTPVMDELFFSIPGKGSFKLENAKSYFGFNEFEDLISKAKNLPDLKKERNFTAVGSRSHMSQETEDYINTFKNKYDKVDILSKGSSLKLCLIAEGLADVYPRFAPTMEWDIAAGHAIINGAGGNVMQANTKQELQYNKENLLNPWFIASLSISVIS